MKKIVSLVILIFMFTNTAYSSTSVRVPIAKEYGRMKIAEEKVQMSSILKQMLPEIKWKIVDAYMEGYRSKKDAHRILGQIMNNVKYSIACFVEWDDGKKQWVDSRSSAWSHRTESWGGDAVFSPQDIVKMINFTDNPGLDKLLISTKSFGPVFLSRATGVRVSS